MKKIYPLVIALVCSSFALSACSEHNCSLNSERDEEKFGELAPVTAGADSCFISEGDLVATHPGMSVEEGAQAYKTKLEAKTYSVEVEDYSGQRGNGGEFEGKRVIFEKGEDTGVVRVYPLTDTIVEAVISVD
jgi:hypothetical protein